MHVDCDHAQRSSSVNVSSRTRSPGSRLTGIVPCCFDDNDEYLSRGNLGRELELLASLQRLSPDYLHYSEYLYCPSDLHFQSVSRSIPEHRLLETFKRAGIGDVIALNTVC